MGIDARVTPWVSGHVLVLFEEDETDPPEIDEAIITLANPEASPWSLAAGRLYVPFGLPESRWLVAPSLGLFEQTTLALEYAHDRDYSQGKGGAGKDTDTLTAQLAVEF